MKIEFSNGFALNLVISGDKFLGIGVVSYQGAPLRSGQLPWTLYTESEIGVRYDRFRLVDIVRKGDEATIILESDGVWLPRIQDADSMGDARIKTRRVNNPVATFRWTFRPVVETIAENLWDALAMRIEVNSPGAPIHWLLEDATWEIGSDAAGSTLIQQDISTIDLEQTVKADSFFSTTERFYHDGDGVWGGTFPMDMLPRASGSAICDFQTKGDLAICLFAQRPGLTRARLEKFADERVIHYTDRPFVKLGETVAFPERKLAVYRHPSPLKRHEYRNLWLDCFTEVRSRILGEYGFKPEVPLPMVASFLWDRELRSLGTSWTDAFIEALPRYAELGYAEVFTHGCWESVTTDPNRTEEDGNICCPYEFRYADLFGGNENMRRLFDAAHAQGMRFYQWFGMQFSKFSPVWKEHPDWVLREANGDPWDANYQSLQAGRMRTGYGQYLEESIKRVKDDTGLDNIFWDSYQNLGATCVDWQGPDKAPQIEDIFAMQGRLQEYGFKQRCEVVTIFGVSQVAFFGFDSDKFRRRLWSDFVAQDAAFVLLDTSPGFFTERYAFVADRVNPQYYFWLAAHRAVPNLDAYPWLPEDEPETVVARVPGGALAEDYARVNRLYRAALPHMHRLRVTEGGKYVLWLCATNKPSAVWAFEDVEIEHRGPICVPETGAVLDSPGKFMAKAGHVYLLSC